MKLGVLACVFALIFCIAEASIPEGAQKSAEDSRKLPLIYWPGGIESAGSLKQAGVDRFAAPSEKADAWRKAGFNVVALSQAELGRREKLLTPRVAGRS